MAKVKPILLFSAGLDSFILKELYGFPDYQCLFIDMGTVENKTEWTFIQNHFPGVQKLSKVELNQFELSNKIIPFRNFYLGMMAANYGSDIFFAFTAGDTTKDKDYVFKAQLEGMLNYFSQNEEKVFIPGPFTIHMPYKNLTKSDLVAKYIMQGKNPGKLITHSCSCYSGNNCGICRSCLRKFVALKVNRINTEGSFQEDPTKYLNDFLEESKQKNRKAEIADIEKTIQICQTQNK